MRKLLLAVAFTALLASSAEAQPGPDPRVADLVRAGKIRFALFLPGYTKDAATGELRGVGTGAVTVQLAQALAERLGIKVELAGFSTPALVVECLNAGVCDLAYMGINPARVGEVGFSLPFMQQDFTYLVPAGSSIHNVADADRTGVRIAVVHDHASTQALKRVLKNAETVSAETPDAAFDLVRGGQANAWATPRFSATASSAQLPGSRVLDDRYGANLIALAVPKDQAGRLAYIAEFVEEAKASGLVQRTIDRAGLRGYEVVVSPVKTN
ncbi:MAG: polar amino acid transport system substrate-binding protein [Alphaproteobacteria bacterium]|nr:polar amino acid transport system substrate-binding protein [Alphaproteobacteria bacterium]